MRTGAPPTTVGRADLPVRQPLLKKPLELAHVKPLVSGTGGTTPGQNFIYVHLNRVIKKYRPSICSTSQVPATVVRRSWGNVYLEGTWSEVYPKCDPGRGPA